MKHDLSTILLFNTIIVDYKRSTLFEESGFTHDSK